MGNIFFKLQEEESNKNNFESNKNNLLLCPKCKKSNCSIRKKSSDTGVELSILLIKCLECDYIFEFD